MKYLFKFKFMRVAIFTIIGFLNSFFMKFTNEIPKNNIIILGRGKSLNYFLINHKNFSHIKHVILLNFTKNDFKNIDSDIFKDKIIHIVVNVVEEFLPYKLLFKFKFGQIFISRYEGFKADEHSSERKMFRGNLYGNKLKLFPNEMESFWWLDNTGLFSIAYVLKILKTKNLYLFGFDFYQGDFHNHKHNDEFATIESAEQHQLAGKKLIENFHILIDQFSENSFFLPDTQNYIKYNQLNVKKLK